MIFILLVVASIILMAIFIPKKDKDDAQEEVLSIASPTTASPSMQPSTSPTTSPTSDRFQVIVQKLSPLLNVTTGQLDPSSTSYEAINWLANVDNTSVFNDDDDDDDASTELLVQRFVLVVLYLSCGGEQWMNQNYWLSPNQDTCDWEHIECSDDGDGDEDDTRPVVVRQILLQNNNLQCHNSLPTEIGLLSSLHVFRADDNPGIQGTIPTEMGMMTNLISWLLGGNSLSEGATIPTEIGNLGPSLRAFQVYSSAISGTIPSEIGLLTNLEFLTVFDNKLTGTIPAEIGNLSRLGFVTVANNTITGSIPNEMGSMEQLTTLALWRNGLNSTIPSSLGNLTNLISLDLSENLLTGSLSSDIGQLELLTTLQIHTNKLNGSIPKALFQLLELTKLELSSNHLEGSIGTEIGQLTNVVEMNAWGNSLTGAIPSEVGSLTSLTQLLLSWNELSGSVPSQIDQLSNLWYLDLHGNNFSDGLDTLFCDRPSDTYILASDCFGLQTPEIACACCNFCCDDLSGSACEEV